MTSIAVIDLETTGVDPATDKICEMAAVRVSSTDIGWNVHDGPHFSTLVNPGIPIPAVASAVHHLTDKDVSDAPTRENVSITFGVPAVIDFWCAHNAPFDSAFLSPEFGPWIDTLRCARHEWPDAPGYKNQELRYWLGVEPDLPPGLAPHRALYDAIVTAEILLKLLEKHTPEKLVEMSGEPVLMRTVPFGQSRGKLWADMDVGFCMWVISPKRDWRSDQKEDLHRTAKHWIAKKRGGLDL